METTINQRVGMIAKKLCNGNISELARITGISQPALRDIVGNKQAKPRFEILAVLAENEMLNINSHWLLTGCGPMTNQAVTIENDCEIETMGVRERIKTFIEHMNLNINEFEKSINVSNGYVNNILKNIGIDKINSIVSQYPMLNIEWLFTGNGSMIKTFPISEQVAVVDNNFLLDRIEKLVIENYELRKSLSNYSGYQIVAEPKK